MTGRYHIDFLIASLVLLLLVRYHFKKQKKLDDAGTQVFGLFLVTGIVDVCLDIVCTVLMGEAFRACAELTRVLMTAFYLIQVLFPYFIVFYTQTLRNAPPEVIRADRKHWGIVPALMGVLILFNYRFELLFGFDSTGCYFKGPAYPVMYGYALCYAVAVAVICIVHRKEFESRDIRGIAEFILIEGICVTVQLCFGQYLMTGFGIGLGIVVLYLMVNNPHVYIESTSGAFNKKYFDIWLQEKLEKGRQIHVLAVDTVNLSRINKVFGTSIGDRILTDIVEQLQGIGEGVQLFRVSGKRFLLAMETIAEYEKCRCFVQELFQNRFVVNGEKIRVTAVISGIVNSESLGSEDIMLAYLEYMAGLVSHTGETVLIQSDSQIMDGFLYEQEIERFLKIAIEEDLFEVYYQPVFSREKGGYVSLEALSRLKHPTLGYVSPDVFITLAEKSGQIILIGELQFRRVCRFLKENRQIMEQVDNVKFNLSPLELLKYGHGKMLVDTIRAFELPFSWFQFEITETVATEYSENLYQAVDTFLQAGIGLCLDDFGSGYANINTVMKLPFSAIKLDRSLLQDVGNEPQTAVFYQSIVEVLQGMGYQVIAEGAETKADVALLSGWNVDMIQGYYFSRPVGEKELLQLLSEKNDQHGMPDLPL